MRAARIENGVVVDLWEVPSLDVYPGVTLVEAPAWVLLGASWDGAEFVNPPVTPVVPPAITRRQLRLWLVRHGVPLSTIEANIAALPEPQRSEAQIEWHDATQYERANPLLVQLAGAVLGLSGAALDQALDQAFIEASAI